MEFKDYYKVLGLERTATQDEIKRTFRKLARQYHPDVSKEAGTEAKFKEIGEAYGVLGDVEKRAAYDQLGSGHQPGQDFTPPPGWDAGFEFSGRPEHGEQADFSDFFETLFGGMRGQGRSQARERRGAEFHARGEDHHAKILIDLRDAFGGATRTLSLRAPEVDATGHVVVKDRTINVTIPKGVVEGQQIRLKGQGSPGSGKLPAGDLYLEVHFKADPLYRPKGRDLYYDLPVTPWEAALGARVKAPTPMGAIMLTIPASSFQGRELRIGGRGIPSPDGAGDLYARLSIVLPPVDSEKAKQAYETMARELPFDPRATLGG